MNKNIFKLVLLLMPTCLFGQREQKKTNVQIDTLLSQKALNRAWTHLEMQQAVNSIMTQLKDTTYVFPTLTNDKKMLFTKLTSYDSYWFLNSNYFTLNDRFKILIGFYEPFKSLLMNYYQKSKLENGKLTYEKEVTEIHGLINRLTIDMVKLADEFIATNPNLTETQLGGLKKMIYGINTMLGGDLIILEKDYSHFSEASICKICKSFKELYSFMYTKIDDSVKIEFDKRISDLIQTNTIQCVTDILKENKK